MSLSCCAYAFFKYLFVVFGIAKRDARIAVGGFYSAHSCVQ